MLTDLRDGSHPTFRGWRYYRMVCGKLNQKWFSSSAYTEDEVKAEAKLMEIADDAKIKLLKYTRAVETRTMPRSKHFMILPCISLVLRTRTDRNRELEFFVVGAPAKGGQTVRRSATNRSIRTAVALLIRKMRETVEFPYSEAEITAALPGMDELTHWLLKVRPSKGYVDDQQDLKDWLKFQSIYNTNSSNPKSKYIELNCVK